MLHGDLNQQNIKSNNQITQTSNNSNNITTTDYKSCCYVLNKILHSINNLFASFDANKYLSITKPKKQVKFVDNNDDIINLENVNSSDNLLFESLDEEGTFELHPTNPLKMPAIKPINNKVTKVEISIFIYYKCIKSPKLVKNV